MSTVFTKIIEGDLPGRFVWADQVCVAFGTIEPITPGHMLVVPRQEAESFTDVSATVFAHLAKIARMIGMAQKQAFDAPRAGIIVAGFDVPHLHIHVMPLWREGQLNLAQASTNTLPSKLDSDAEEVRAALIDLGKQQFVPINLDSPDLATPLVLNPKAKDQ